MTCTPFSHNDLDGFDVAAQGVGNQVLQCDCRLRMQNSKMALVSNLLRSADPARVSGQWIVDMVKESGVDGTII